MWQVVLLSFFVASAMIGLITAVIMVVARAWTTRIIEAIGEIRFKIAHETIQTTSALTGVLGSFKSSPEQKATWLVPVIAGSA